jgi:hypothetical protein
MPPCHPHPLYKKIILGGNVIEELLEAIAKPMLCHPERSEGSITF